MVKDSIEIQKYKNNCSGSAGMQPEPEATALYTEVVEPPFRCQENTTSGNGREPSEKNPDKTFFEAHNVHTLAQPGTKQRNNLTKRALAKFMTDELIYPLIDLKSTLEKSYWNTYHCTRVLLQDGNKITGNYCNHRWCLVCNRIRTAKLINGYLPVIKRDFKEPMFVTLTVPNVPGKQLKSTITDMTKTIIKINHKFRHRRDFRLKGIRKIEVTHNIETNEFHPHFHILIDGHREANELVSHWLNNYSSAVKKAQNIQKADNNSLIELFKYSTKLTAESKDNPQPLDTIFKALYRKRIFQPMGIKKIDQVNEDIEKLQSQEIENLQADIDCWVWEHDIKDWCNASGEILTAKINLLNNLGQ